METKIDKAIIEAIVRKNTRAFNEFEKRSKKYAKRINRILETIKTQIMIISDYMQCPRQCILNLDNYCVLCAYYSEKLKGNKFLKKIDFSDLTRINNPEVELIVISTLSAYEIFVVSDVDDYAVRLLGTKQT